MAYLTTLPQNQEVRFPTPCVVCGREEPDAHLYVKPNPGETTFAIPICASCRLRSGHEALRHKARKFLAIFLSAAALMAITYYSFTAGVDAVEIPRILFFSVLLIFLFMFTFGDADAPPVTVSTLPNNTIQFTFRSIEYGEAFEQLNFSHDEKS